MTLSRDSTVEAVVLLQAIRQLAVRCNALCEERDDYVMCAREAGATWSEVADALGVSKQAAWERFARFETIDTAKECPGGRKH